MKSFWKLLLKIVITAGCLWYVGQKIDWADTFRLFASSHKVWLFFATLFFTGSKVLSSLRLNHFFRDINIGIDERTNLKLYWLGMYYNLFLPGGIGGDAYKVILLNRHFETVSVKRITASVLLDRISGVVGLGLLGFICSGVVFISNWVGWISFGLMVPGVILYYFLVKKWFPSFIRSFFPTLWMGLAVQLFQIICIYGVMQSIGINHSFFVFQLLFLLSSIVAIFPFTIGGLGARELVFLWGANQFGLQQSEAVYISLLFYLITVVTSFIGVIWVYRLPMLKNKPVPNE